MLGEPLVDLGHVVGRLGIARKTLTRELGKLERTLGLGLDDGTSEPELYVSQPPDFNALFADIPQYVVLLFRRS